MSRLCFVLITIGITTVLGREIQNEPKQNNLRHVIPKFKMSTKFISDVELTEQEGPNPPPPVLAHIVQHGSNLFYKPHITFPALAIAAPKPTNKDCEEDKETDFIIEPADPQLTNPIKEEITIEEDKENIAQYAPEPPKLPVQFIEAEQFSGPFIIPPARPLPPISLPERPQAIVFKPSTHIPDTHTAEVQEVTPIKIPAAPTLAPFEISDFPIFVPTVIREEFKKEDCITPVHIVSEKQEINNNQENLRIPVPIPSRFCIICMDNVITDQGN